MHWRIVAALAGAVALAVAACGSETGSDFTGDGEADAGATNGGGSSSGQFAPGGGGPDTGSCKPKTCEEANANCGPISDGCGSIVQCGTCPEGETCGGGGTPSRCGKPPCTPLTCADLGAECGLQGDGCGDVLDCGTCEAGICGGGGPNKCGTGGLIDGGTCVPTKTECEPDDCGPIGDGCGNVINCPATCPPGQTCGGGGPSKCGEPACQALTCGDATCGFKPDGCGKLLNCWPDGVSTCPPGERCGAENKCEPIPGCTGLCQQQQQCPGGATTAIEGYVTSPNGVLPIPNAVVYVPNGPVEPFEQGVKCETCATASGNPLISTTTDANGYFLLPNMPVSTPGKVVDIPVVVQLGRWRKQFTVQTTACTTTKVPKVGDAPPNKTAALPRNQSEGDIPLTAISTGDYDGLECVFRKIGVDDSEFTSGAGNGRIHLYQDDGVGGGAGGACAPGCGDNCSQSGSASCPKASKLYGGGYTRELRITRIARSANQPYIVRTSSNHNLQTGDQIVIFGVTNPSGANGTWTVTREDADDIRLDGSNGPAITTQTYSTNNRPYIYVCNGACDDDGLLDKYDAVIFSCTGGESRKPANARQNVIDYANKGGRVFATHYSYVWLFSTRNNSPSTLNFTSPWAATANTFDPLPINTRWDGSLTAKLDTSFPKGLLFANWLRAPVGNTSASYPPPYPPVNALTTVDPPEVTISEPRANITPTDPNIATSGIVAPAQRWMYTTTDSVKSRSQDPAPRHAPLHYTFNTPWGAEPASQCGRVLFSDFHVTLTGGNSENKVFPAECDDSPLTAQEKILAYMLFDLASCVSAEGPPECQPKTCQEQGIGCGLAGDGCGNVINCGDCPAGQTCGGAGIPNQCGAPPCQKQTCGPNECGLKGDGCGSQLDCGSCQDGKVCGAGGPNLCGEGSCTPLACPTPAEGSACGPVADGCGSLNNCPCPDGMPCVNGRCGAPPCTPRTCQEAGANCGEIADGCGSTVNCGTCVPPQTCGGGGIPNVCGGGVK